jgi:hypothetical protein
MTATITSNRSRTSAVIHVAGANATLQVTGNNAVSNIASPGETLTGVYITQAAWGCDPDGFIIIKRDDTPVAFYDSTGQHDYAGCGMPITVNQYANNISIEFANSNNCFIIFEVQKIGDNLTANSEYFQI